LASLNTCQKSNAEQVNDSEFDGLFAQAAEIMNNADSVLAKFESEAVAA
jgi:hypothetical protein